MTHEDGARAEQARVAVICAGLPNERDLRLLVESRGPSDILVVCLTTASEPTTSLPGVSLLPRGDDPSEVRPFTRAAMDSDADLVAFCRADSLLSAPWLAQAVEVLGTRADLAAVGLHLDPAAAARPSVLAVGFDGLVVRRDVFVRSGGFDDRLGIDGAAFDLCWRLTILGHGVGALPPPEGVASADARPVDDLERQRTTLIAAAKNLEPEAASSFLAATIAEEVRRSIVRGGADASVLDLQRSPGGDEIGTIMLRTESLDGARAVEALLDHLRSLTVSRSELIHARRVPDRAVFPLLRHELEVGWLAAEAVPGVADVRSLLGMERVLLEPLRVVLMTGDTVADRRRARIDTLHESLESAGLAVRDVRLDGPAGTSADEVAWADVLVVQSEVLADSPWLPTLDRVVVVLDLDAGAAKLPADVLTGALARADLVVCGSGDERDFWLGALSGVERVNAAVYDEDASLDALALSLDGDGPDGLEPVVAFCRAPRRAADLASADEALRVAGTQQRPPRPGTRMLVRQYYAAGGVGEVVRRASGRVGKKVRRTR